MDFENLENMEKNEFVALGTNVKQELVDNGIVDDTAAETTAGSNEINSASTASNIPDANETNNPVCDSAEKQVNQIHLKKIIRKRAIYFGNPFVDSCVTVLLFRLRINKNACIVATPVKMSNMKYIL